MRDPLPVTQKLIRAGITCSSCGKPFRRNQKYYGAKMGYYHTYCFFAEPRNPPQLEFRLIPVEVKG